MKILFQFNVMDKKEIEIEEISKNESGEEIKIVKKIKTDAPVEIAIRKPNRGLFDEAELFYGVKLSEGIKAGLLTRALLAKRFSNDGGVFSEMDKEEYSKLYVKLFELQLSFQKISIKEKSLRTNEENEEYSSLVKEIASTREKLQDYEFAQASLFEQTAENRARNKTIMWWVLKLSLFKKDNQFVDLFPGDSIEEKLDKYDLIEDQDESTWEKKALSKLIYLISFWYTGRASAKEEFEKLIAIVNEEQEAKELPGDKTEK